MQKSLVNAANNATSAAVTEVTELDHEYLIKKETPPRSSPILGDLISEDKSLRKRSFGEVDDGNMDDCTGPLHKGKSSGGNYENLGQN